MLGVVVVYFALIAAFLSWRIPSPTSIFSCDSLPPTRGADPGIGFHSSCDRRISTSQGDTHSDAAHTTGPVCARVPVQGVPLHSDLAPKRSGVSRPQACDGRRDCLFPNADVAPALRAHWTGMHPKSAPATRHRFAPYWRVIYPGS